MTLLNRGKIHLLIRKGAHNFEGPVELGKRILRFLSDFKIKKLLYAEA